VNPAPIPAQAPGSTEGRPYVYRCDSCRPASWYRLDVVELSGARWSAGPVLADERRPNAVRLQSLSAGSYTGPSSSDVLLVAVGFSCAAIALAVYARRKLDDR
jgi:hypothetical protein